MAPDSLAPELILWTDPHRATLCGHIIRAMDASVRLIGVGGPRGSDAVKLAQQHALPCTDDLRKLLVEHPATFLLLATAEPVDSKLLQLAMNQGTTILTLEPIASNFDQIITTKAPQGEGRLLTLPAFTFSPAWTKAGETQDLLGHIRLIAFESVGPLVQQSLHARHAEAWQIITRLAAMPESIDCSLVGPLTEIPDDPRAITGHLTAHARLPRGAAAQITLSDQASRHRRRLMIIGDLGRLLMTDTAYQLFGRDAENNKHDMLIEDVDLTATLPLDETGLSEDEAAANIFAQLAAAQWRRLIDHPDHPWQTSSTQDQAANLACQMAALLSARTGQAESPSKMAMLARM